jgi:hypothetical protein
MTVGNENDEFINFLNYNVIDFLVSLLFNFEYI